MKMTALIDPTGTLELELNGTKTSKPHASVAEARRAVMTAATELATETSDPTELHIEDPSGSRTVLVQTDGDISEHSIVDAHGDQQEPDDPAPAAAEEPADTPTEAPVSEPAETPATTEPAPAEAPAAAPAAVAPAAVETAAAPPEVEPPMPAEAPAEAPVEVLAEVPAARGVGARERKTPARRKSVEPVPIEAPTEVPAGVPAHQVPAPGAEPVRESAGERESVEALPRRRESMPSFVDRPDQTAPARAGVRGALNQFGMKLAPSPAELGQREDEKTVSRHWAGPRMITVLNPKGGAGKTPTTVCLGAVFARMGGSGVLAWDNNNSLGSLGWRTFDAGHEATVVDLLAQTDYFMTAQARAGDLASYVHHQPSDQYDVLRSDDRSGAKHRHEVTGAEVHRLYDVAAKYYRLIIADSGNTERGDNWEAMIGHTDQVVIPVKSVDDAAEGASRVLSALRAGNEHAQTLADEAVVIILGSTPAHGKKKLDGLAESFRPFVKSVATVPYDPSLVEGRIRFSAMLPVTRRAWLGAAAQIAEGL